ncbi:hypothetical protein [Deinococcus frigens]|uniref:hypothetical protein n=1 Tax=Deinococcus frigens TaxID=249403 RepID=UPI0004958127|nr:hypothetical protein [Deinococcus frigens]
MVAALQAHGIKVGDPVEAGEWHAQGEGTYAVLPLEGGDLALSTLGRFGAQHVWGGAGSHSAATIDRIRVALAAMGWPWLDDEVMSVTVPGLNVYYFGAWESLTVGELLFYCQD